MVIETWTEAHGDLGDAGRARRFVQGLLEREGVDTDLLEDAVLCASEAVTNALRHAEGLSAIRVAVSAAAVRVEVEDDVPGDLAASAPEPTAISGRGLLIIDSVAARWGVEPSRDGGKVVWFELDRTTPADDEGAPQRRSADLAVTRTGLRPRALAALAAVAGAGGSVPVGAWTAELDQPELALVVLGSALVLATTLVGGFVPGLVGALGLGAGTLAFHGEDRLATEMSTPLLALGTVGVGLIVASFAWAGIELRARARVRAGLFARLTDLAVDLATIEDSVDPVATVERLAAEAAGAPSARVLAALPAAAQVGASRASVVLPLEGPARYRSLELRLPGTPSRIPAAENADFLRSVADRCAQALERIELRQAERRARADVEVLADASRVLSSSLSVDRVISSLRGIVVPQLAERCAVLLDRPGRPGEPAPGGDGGGSSGMAVADLPDALVLELRSRDRRLGRLVATRSGEPFDDDDRALLTELAARAAVAIDNAQLYEEQTLTTGVLEGSLLPHALLPVERLDLGARYLAATSGHLVGGDFYDAVRTTDGGTMLLVGDVQGKGVEAATLTAVARHTLRSAALAGESPATMLSRVNDALRYHEAERELVENDAMVRFITAAVVQLTPEGDGFRARVAAGGHPHPIVVRAAGGVEQIKASGPLLGVFDRVDCDEVTLHLGLADVLVLYTDGVIEHRAAEDLFDEAQLGRLVRNQLTVSRAEDLAQVVLDTVVGLAPTESRDDIAVLVARVTRE